LIYFYEKAEDGMTPEYDGRLIETIKSRYPEKFTREEKIF